MFADEKTINKVKHIMPILPVYFIILTVIYSFTLYFAMDDQNNLIKTIMTKLFYIFASGTIICHVLAMFTSPGEIEKKKITENSNNHNNSTNDPLFCKKCITNRPHRTHHCKVCNKCILKMDHHCPWVGNCVGLNNQKFFYQFLFYATIGDFIAFICLLTKVLEIDLDSHLKDKKFNTVSEIFIELKDPLIIIFTCLEAFTMTLAIGFLFAMQTRGIMFNFTTIEEKTYKDTKDNQWYNLNKLENMKMVMGDKIHHWFFPIRVDQNGYNIPKSSDKNNYLSLSDNIQEFEDIHISLNLND